MDLRAMQSQLNEACKQTSWLESTLENERNAFQGRLQALSKMTAATNRIETEYADVKEKLRERNKQIRCGAHAK